jgi:hypothetical protein
VCELIDIAGLFGFANTLWHGFSMPPNSTSGYQNFKVANYLNLPQLAIALLVT